MNDRIYQALTAAGLSTSPLSVLDHASTYASAFFALYDAELLYHEGGKNSQVPLRDVTRIHSDREGVLRVETSERTAVTASLVGYDPGRVQAFFQQVRDVTARAKDLPVLPLNQAKTEVPGPPNATLPGSSVPVAGMPGLSAYTPATPSGTAPATPAPAFTPAPGTPAAVPVAGPVAVPVAVPVPTSPAPGAPPVVLSAVATPVPSSPVNSAPVNPAPAAAPAPVAPTPPAPTSPAPSASAPASPGTVTATRRESPRPEPVVISSMPPVSDPPAFQERAGERNRQATSQPAGQAVSQAVRPRTAEPDTDPQDTGAAGGLHTQGALASLPITRPAEQQTGGDPNEALGLVSELQRRAEGVQGLARTVGLLAVVLGLAAVALAYFQWRNSSMLSAIWTLLAGGVGAVALLAFAEALRLLSALARSAQRSARHRQE